MKKSIALALASVLVIGSAPAYAATDCDGGYKTFLGKMTKMVETVNVPTIADALRKGLAAYDNCKAGDSFSPHGVWDQIVADTEAAMKK